jgi:hypothetical protein
MSKTFRPWKIEEPLLLPVAVADFVAESHLARFVLSVVRDEVDLGQITGTYGSEFGQPPFNPIMMTALLLYLPGNRAAERLGVPEFPCRTKELRHHRKLDERDQAHTGSASYVRGGSA